MDIILDGCHDRNIKCLTPIGKFVGEEYIKWQVCVSAIFNVLLQMECGIKSKQKPEKS